MNIVETDRLIIREWDESDLNDVAGIYADPEVMQYDGARVPVSAEKVAGFIRRQIDYNRQHGFCIWPVFHREDQRVIGHCGLQYLGETKDIEILWLLDKKYWGAGLGTEAARAMLEYAFKKLRLGRIVALSYPENKASLKIIEKLGMEFEKDTISFDKKCLRYSIEPE